MSCGAARLGQFRGNRVAFTQARTALGFAGTAHGGGAGLLQLGFEAANLGFERPRVDLEQQVAFGHQRAFGEGDLVDLPGNPGAYFYGLWRFQAPGEFIPFVDGLFQHLGHTDFGRGRGLGSLRGTTTGAHHHQCQGGKRVAQMFE
ncbi:hypothetical protein D9M71_291300 [compost metagenome]